MEAGQQSQEGVSMGSAAVIFVLLVVIAILVICVQDDKRKIKALKEARDFVLETLSTETSCNTQLEAEIQRLRKIPLTQPPEKVDNSTIKAKSSADVRRLTEAAFGLQPEIGVSNEDE
jgi:uncharacterized protein YpmS